MEQNSIFLCIVILLILIASKCSKEYYDKNHYCSNCYKLSEKDCKQCPNCGMCTDNAGNKSCLQGNRNGANFNAKCVKWRDIEEENQESYLLHSYESRTNSHIEY